MNQKVEKIVPKKLPIQLTIYADHYLPNDALTVRNETAIQATECVFIAEGIYRVIERVCKDAAFADRAIHPIPMPEMMLLAVGQLAQLGSALTTSATDLIDRLEHPALKTAAKQ